MIWSRCIAQLWCATGHSRLRISLAIVRSVRLAIFALLAGVASASAGQHALVIGIDAYTGLKPLLKAANDSRTVAQTMRSLGFAVMSGQNLTRRQMVHLFSEFESRIEPGDTAFFFFAGHGVGLGPDNILLAADLPQARSNQDGLVRDEGFSVDHMLRRIKGRGAKHVIFVLDACRDNPFENVGVRGIGGTRGLSRMDAPQGVFVLFSAGIGQTALDRLPGNDPDPNSVFTRKLAPLLATPGITHVRLAKRVQAEVSALAGKIGHAQQPAYYDQIIGEVTLSEASAGTSAPAARPPRPSRTDEAASQQASAQDAMRQRGNQALTASLVVPRPRIDGERCATRRASGRMDFYCVSSVLEPQAGNSYGPSQLFDGRPETAWVEGRKGDGLGEGIVIEFDGLRAVREIALMNGYNKNKTSFERNNRAKTLRLRFSSGEQTVLALEDRLGRQIVRLSRPVNARWLHLTIDSVFKGAKWPDTALSELEVIGDPVR